MPRRRRLRVSVLADTRDFNKGIREAERQTRELGNRAAASRENVTRLGRALDSLGRSTTGIRNSVAAANVQALRFQKTLDRTSRRAQIFRSRMLSLRGVVGTVFGAGVVGAAIRQAALFGTQLENQASLIGLSVEALQEYRGAAGEVGIQQRAVDVALQRLTRRLGEASMGSGVLAKNLEQYDIAVRDSFGNTRSLEAVLGDMADVFRSIESESERARFAFSAFDTEGVRFAEVLRSGSEGLEEARERVRQIGVLTTEQARQLDALRNAFDDFGRSVSTSFQGVIADNSEDLQRLLNTLALRLPQALQSVGVLARAVSENIGLIGVAISGLLALRIGRLTLEFAQWARHIAAARAAATGASGLSAVIGGLGAGLAVTGVGLAALAAAFIGVAVAAKRARDRMREVQEQARRSAEQASQTALVISQSTEAELRSRADSARQTADNLRQEIARIEALQTRSAQRQASRAPQSAQGQLYRDRAESLERLREQLGFAIRDEQRYEEALRGIGDSTQTVSETTKSLADQLAEVRKQIEAVSTAPGDIALLRELRDANEELERRKQIQAELVDADRAATAQTREWAAQLQAVNEQLALARNITLTEVGYARAIRDANEELERQRRIREGLINLDRERIGATVVQIDLPPPDLITEPITRLTDGTKVAQERVDDLSASFDSLSSTIASGLSAAVTGTQNLNSTLTQLASQLVRITVQAGILAALGAIIPGIGGGAGFGSLFGQLLGFRQSGGPVRPGRPYVVGERRPELFIPDRPGRIEPDLSGLEGERIELHLNVAAGVDEFAFRRAIRESIPEIDRGLVRLRRRR